jgi:hypothetical protein
MSNAANAPSPAYQVTLDLDPHGPSSFVLEPPAYQLHVWLPETGLVTHQGYVGIFHKWPSDIQRQSEQESAVSVATGEGFRAECAYDSNKGLKF